MDKAWTNIYLWNLQVNWSKQGSATYKAEFTFLTLNSPGEKNEKEKEKGIIRREGQTISIRAKKHMKREEKKLRK